MGSIVVQTFLTLDGVMQAPGGQEEDTEGGFPYGGWQFDERFGDGIVELILDWESRTEALLLGRKTYQLWSGAWGVWPEDAPGIEGELTRRYNRVPKYVASHQSIDLPWKNSHLLGPDVPGAVARLRDETEGELRIWGSSELIGSLAERDLIDEYRLAVYPLILGTGKRLFPDGFAYSQLDLAETQALPGGVVVNTYRRAGSTA